MLDETQLDTVINEVLGQPAAATAPIKIYETVDTLDDLKDLASYVVEDNTIWEYGDTRHDRYPSFSGANIWLGIKKSDLDEISMKNTGEPFNIQSGADQIETDGSGIAQVTDPNTGRNGDISYHYKIRIIEQIEPDFFAVKFEVEGA